MEKEWGTWGGEWDQRLRIQALEDMKEEVLWKFRWQEQGVASWAEDRASAKIMGIWAVAPFWKIISELTARVIWLNLELYRE